MKTLIFNTKYFGIKGLRINVLVSRNKKLMKLKGKIEYKSKKRSIIGFGPLQDCNQTKGYWYNTGLVIFNGDTHFYSGAEIYNTGKLVFGNNVRFAASKLFCRKHIEIGNNSMVSWGGNYGLRFTSNLLYYY